MNNEKRTISELLISLENEKENSIDKLENNTSLTNEQVKQLSEYFEVDTEDIEELDYKTYGLINIDIGLETYVLAEDYEDAEKAARECLKDFFDEMPYGFSIWVLCDNSEISYSAMEDLIKYEANEVIKELVDMEGLIDDCISSDGVGHQLALYDSEELKINDMYLYRTD